MSAPTRFDSFHALKEKIAETNHSASFPSPFLAFVLRRLKRIETNETNGCARQERGQGVAIFPPPCLFSLFAAFTALPHDGGARSFLCVKNSLYQRLMRSDVEQRSSVTARGNSASPAQRPVAAIGREPNPAKGSRERFGKVRRNRRGVRWLTCPHCTVVLVHVALGRQRCRHCGEAFTAEAADAR